MFDGEVKTTKYDIPMYNMFQISKSLRFGTLYTNDHMAMMSDFYLQVHLKSN